MEKGGHQESFLQVVGSKIVSDDGVIECFHIKRMRNTLDGKNSHIEVAVAVV